MDTQYLRKILFGVVSSLVAVAVSIYLLYHFFSDFNTGIEVIPAEVYNQEETITLDAYILRDESVLYMNNGGGDVDLLVRDGEKIKKGTVIANVYSGSDGNEIRNEIIEIDKKIQLYENSNIDITTTVSDTSNIDSQINQLYYVICSRIESGDIKYAMQKQDELLVLLNKRKIITKTVESYSDKILKYENMKNELTSTTGEISDKIFAAKSGYFYSEIDGYENIFSSSKIDDMTLEDFNSMTGSSPDSKITESVSTVGKLVGNYKWYVSCKVDSATVRKFSVNREYSIVFPYNEDTVIKMKLYRIITEINSDEAVLIFESGKMPENFSYLRMQEINAVITSYTGFKLPVDAVRVVDGELGVYVLNGNVVKFKKINILTEISGYVIVERTDINDEEYRLRLSEYENIIVKGKDLYDGKIIN